MASRTRVEIAEKSDPNNAGQSEHSNVRVLISYFDNRCRDFRGRSYHCL